MSTPTSRDARSVVLERIRAALGVRPIEAAIPVEYRVPVAPDVDLITRFADRLAGYHAIVHRVPRATMTEAIADVLAKRPVRRLVVPDGLPEAWLTRLEVERLTDVPQLGHGELDRADGVITACSIAIAETGTIVMGGGPGQGRRALSLLPDYHLCVVDADQIVANVPEALARIDALRPLTWISGPSATSDIELSRVEGVHGPRTLEVLIVVDWQHWPVSGVPEASIAPGSRGTGRT